jgi:hypothetical protein
MRGVTGMEDNERQKELEEVLFHWLSRKYVQYADERQKAMGLIYMEAETHNLAKELKNFIMWYEKATH